MEVCIQIFLNKTGTFHHNVTIQEKQPFILSLLSQEITDRCPTYIFFADDIVDIRQFLDILILFYHFLVGGTIVNNDNLITEPFQFLCFLFQDMVHGVDEVTAEAVISGNQYR